MMVATNSQRLRGMLSMVQPRLNSLIYQVWSHSRLGELYPEFLFATYGVTVASAPAMRVAADLCTEGDQQDSITPWLREYYLEHAAEEEHHGEWLLEDLHSLGVTRERVYDRLPYPSVAALVGSQYYWMRHVHPIAYLGFIAVLEAPTEIEFLEQVSIRNNIPLTSMSCHTRHAALDTEHVAEFDSMLDSLSLTNKHQDLITASAVGTIAHLERVFTDILEHFERIDHPGTASTLFTAERTMLV